MSIELDPIASGYNLSKINNNFQKVEDELNNNVLRRDGLTPGENNSMEVDLDMNSHAILNAITDYTDDGSLVTVGEFKRAVRVPHGETIADAPALADRVGKVSAWDVSNGNPIAVSPISTPSDLAVALASATGSTLIGTQTGINLQTYLDGLYYDVTTSSEAALPTLFTSHNHIILRTGTITGPINVPAYKKLTILPPLGQTNVLVTGSGKKILLNRGSELYAPNLTCLSYTMDVVTVVGSSRPSLILAVSERPKIEVNIQSEYKLGRGIVMDANTNASNVRGIITGVDINAVIRGMDTAYEEQMVRNGLEDGPTYINDNHVRLMIWQCRRGLIQYNYTHGVTPSTESTANSYELSYQSDNTSVDVVHIYGARNTVTGVAWDFLYPNLHAQSIKVYGVGNTVGSRNFPALNSGFVTILDPIANRNNYTGAQGGIDRQDIAQTLMMWKPRHFSHPSDTTITMPSSLFMFKDERVVAAGTLTSVVTKQVYFRDSSRLPLNLLGDVYIRNHSATTASVRVAIGLSNVTGNHALSETFTIAAAGLIRVPLNILLTSNRMYGTAGTVTWYGFPVLTDTVNINLSLTTDVPVTLAGCCFHMSKYDY